MNVTEDHEAFRNELASVAPDGRRRWIYARQPAGRFYRARTILSWFLLAFLLSAPFVTVGGLPLILLDVIGRRFVLFGILFWPQDFYLVVLVALAAIVTLALSTAAVGRVWCGWLCPQTVFMEMVFRRLEYFIEGSAAQQLRRDRGGWEVGRVWRKGVKHAVFIGLSFGIANVFLAYVIGAEELRRIVTAPPRDHLAGLMAITCFSGLFYAVFARFREQACVLACPYGRVMSSLIDRRTVTVTYDTWRGEPRGKVSRAALEAPQPLEAASGTTMARPRGDCVDCHQCVTVCPTGIDIRNGVQLECVNCTACMDACDDVMRRLDRQPGLIRLTSHQAMQGEATRWLTPRVTAYAAVWLVLLAGVGALIASRPDVDVLILRQAGTMYTTMQGGEVGNFYTVQVFNRTARNVPFEIVAVSPKGARITPLGALARVERHGLLESRLLLALPPGSQRTASTPVRFEVRTGADVQYIDSSFIGPARRAAE